MTDRSPDDDDGFPSRRHVRASAVHVLLLHGAGGGPWEWNLWAPVLEAHGLIPHAIDIAPHPEGLAPTTLDHETRQANDALSALPHPRVVIGASLGGLHAARIAHGADGLVLVNALPPAPWHSRLPPREWPDVIHWRRDARLASTRRALPDGDDATALFVFRHWRDASGATLRAAHSGIEVSRPGCPILFVVSERDDDVPPEVAADWSRAWDASLLRTRSPSHVGPLLGMHAAGIADQVAAWISSCIDPADSSPC